MHVLVFLVSDDTSILLNFEACFKDVKSGLNSDENTILYFTSLFAF